MSTLKVDTILKRTGTGTITLGQSGDTIALGSGASSTGFGEVNTPAFSVQLGFNQSQSVSDNVITKVQLDDEYFDTDGAFDATTNYRFTVPSGKAGKYFFTWGIYLYQTVNANLEGTEAVLYLNGSRYIGANQAFQTNYIKFNTNGYSAFLDLSVGDYIELYGTVNTNNGAGSPEFYGGDRATFLTGFRVTT